MQKEEVEKINAFISENKGKRKFAQSVELAINFKGLDFNKVENRLNLSVLLPHGKGKTGKAAIFTDDPKVSEQAKKMGAKIITSQEIAEISKNPVMQNELLLYETLAQPSLMPIVAKNLGQFLGPRGKMPKPLVGSDVENVFKNISKSIYIRSKGKYLPTAHCVVGIESMSTDQLCENIDAVFAEVVKKVGRQSIRSMYVKLTMSKPLKLM